MTNMVIESNLIMSHSEFESNISIMSLGPNSTYRRGMQRSPKTMLDCSERDYPKHGSDVTVFVCVLMTSDWPSPFEN